MRILMHRNAYIGALVVLLLGVGAFFVLSHDKAPERATTTVERGNVTNLVSVSGVVEAPNTAELAFPDTGIVTGVYVDEGMHVQEGDILATLAASELAAERTDALAALRSAEAARAELVAGPREEARTITETSIETVKTELARITQEQNEKVAHARRILYSNDLEALSSDGDEQATAPLITGTYTCEEEGTYTILPYASNAESGYSFKLEGLESGTYTAFTDQPGGFGACGLFIQFTADNSYNYSEWVLSVPNTRSSTYATYKNAYDLAQTQRDNAITAAEEAVRKAEEGATLENAAPRNEALDAADARIAQAQARIAVIDARIRNRSIVAPFEGIITDVIVLPGEVATQRAVITLLASDAFELVARVPEIDITDIVVGQKTEMVFDANTRTTLTGTISFISPLALEIDGVAYFKARIDFDEVPDWIRSGLNADIEIVTAQHEHILRLPKRFVTEKEPGAGTVLMRSNDNTYTEQPIELGLIGNDGYIEVIGLDEGTIVAAP